MLKSYDELNKQDVDGIAKCGSSVSILTDAIIEKLTNLVNSERTLTCRNVLIANYDTMTAAESRFCRFEEENTADGGSDG